ncbi:MAG: hypothetical protein JW754_05160 [Candidatus Aenigmarchaeota archaeon]|nr:hypothetical protein [Candidatus Aenigmarchaeota archaeon]
MGYCINLDGHSSFVDFVSHKIKERGPNIVGLSTNILGDSFDTISPYDQVMKIYEKMDTGGNDSDDLHEYRSRGWRIRLAQESAPEGCDKRYLSHWELEKEFSHNGDGKRECSIIFAEVPERGNGKRKYCVEFAVKGTDYKEDFCLVESLENIRIAGIVAACAKISDISLNETTEN